VVQFIRPYVRVSEPLSFADAPQQIQQYHYRCSVTMRKLNGIPLAIYEEWDTAQVKSRFDDLFLRQIDHDQFEVMTHLAFNGVIQGFFGRTYSAAQLGYDNPPRGYFTTKGAGFLSFLREKYGLALSDTELESMIGFIYGWIYYACDIVPIDIEITLGLNRESGLFEVNVLDFGMTFDKRAPPERNHYAYNTSMLFDIAASTHFNTKQREKAYLKRTIKDLQTNLYGTLTGNSRRYFDYAKGLKPCASCQKTLTSLVHPHYAVFICSTTCLSLYCDQK
jgi:hypothetical protein